jgi:hypothetical protein
MVFQISENGDKLGVMVNNCSPRAQEVKKRVTA